MSGSAMIFRESLSAHAGILDGPSGFFVFMLLTNCLHSYRVIGWKPNLGKFGIVEVLNVSSLKNLHCPLKSPSFENL